MAQLQAAYPELRRPGAPTIEVSADAPPASGESAIKRAVKPLDFDHMLEEVEVTHPIAPCSPS